MKNDGGYRVRNGRIHVFGMVDGKEVRKSTGKEATAANIKYYEKNYREVLLKLVNKQDEVKQKIKLEEFALEVIEMSAHRRDANTQKDYISKLNKHILPYFSHYALADIKSLDIEKWQNTLAKTLSPQSVRRIRNVFKMVLHKAVGNDIITKNPIDFADAIEVTHEKQEPYSLEEMLLLMRESKGWFQVYLNLAFTTGMRVGELLALKWDDVDFDKGIIHIARSTTKGVIKESSKNKNHNRIAVMPRFVSDMLNDFKHDIEWIFPSSRTGKPFNESKTIVKYHLKPLLKKLNIEYKTLYATRHTFVSLMRNEGVDKDFIQELVGHAANSAVTDKHYTTFKMNATKIAAVNNVFDGLLVKES